jgi:hypothetical protein
MKRLLLTLALSSLSLPGALAETPGGAPPAVVGTWSLEGPGQCAGTGEGLVHFTADGRVEIRQYGRASAVGFWEAAGPTLALHLLVAPGSDTVGVAGFTGRYSYVYASLRVSSAGPSRLELTSDTAPGHRVRVLDRCP